MIIGEKLRFHIFKSIYLKENRTPSEQKILNNKYTKIY